MFTGVMFIVLCFIKHIPLVLKAWILVKIEKVSRLGWTSVFSIVPQFGYSLKNIKYFQNIVLKKTFHKITVNFGTPSLFLNFSSIFAFFQKFIRQFILIIYELLRILKFRIFQPSIRILNLFFYEPNTNN